MLARFQQNGGKVEWRKYTDDAVSAVMSHPSGGSVEIEWTYKMAERAGLTKNNTWRQYPRQMLRARVISEGIRTVFPGVAVGVYTPEEVADFDAKRASIGGQTTWLVGSIADKWCTQVSRELLTYVLADPRTIDRATYLGWVAHNLERAADRVTNICERVVFMVTGELTELDQDHGLAAMN
jgi:hypothetical protein